MPRWHLGLKLNLKYSILCANPMSYNKTSDAILNETYKRFLIYCIGEQVLVNCELVQSLFNLIFCCYLLLCFFACIHALDSHSIPIHKFVLQCSPFNKQSQCTHYPPLSVTLAFGHSELLSLNCI